MSIDSSTFTSNQAISNSSNGAGGGAVGNDETMELTGDTFTNNTATANTACESGYGGGVENDFVININSSTFTGNSAVNDDNGNGEGGGFANFDVATVNNATITGNSVTNGSGGGLAEDGEGETLSGSTLSGNFAHGVNEGIGGGMYTDEPTVMTNTTISNNHADNCGGGVYNDDADIWTNSLISGNTANFGGGVFNELPRPGDERRHRRQHRRPARTTPVAACTRRNTSDANLDFVGVTVAGNHSDTGAGLTFDGDATRVAARWPTPRWPTTGPPAATEADCAFINDSAATCGPRRAAA